MFSYLIPYIPCISIHIIGLWLALCKRRASEARPCPHLLQQKEKDNLCLSFSFLPTSFSLFLPLELGSPAESPFSVSFSLSCFACLCSPVDEKKRERQKRRRRRRSVQLTRERAKRIKKEKEREGEGEEEREKKVRNKKGKNVKEKREKKGLP